MRTSTTIALMLSAFIVTTASPIAYAQNNAKITPYPAPPVGVIPPYIPLQPNLPGSIQSGMPGIPNTTAGSQALGQGGLPSRHMPGAHSPYTAPRLSEPRFTCPRVTGGTTLPESGAGAIYGSRYGENVGGGPGSTNAQASAILGTNCSQ